MFLLHALPTLLPHFILPYKILSRPQKENLHFIFWRNIAKIELKLVFFSLKYSGSFMKPALITLDLKSLLQAVTIVSLFSNDYRFGVKCPKPITVLNLIELTLSFGNWFSHAYPLFAGNSIKDDSLYSTSTQKQSIDSVALSRGLSVKRFLPDRSAAASAAAECGKAAAIPKMFTSKVMMTSSAHLNLYTQEQELCLNIYPAKDSLSRSTENLSRISIQLNRLSSDETLSHSLQRSHICATPISSSSTSATTQAPTSIIRQATTFAGLSLDDKLNLQQRANSRAQLPRDVTNLDLICSQQGEIKIFIKRKNRHKDNRLKLWRYLHRMSPLKGKQSRHNQHPTAVHFYSPVKYAQRESSEGEHNSKSVSSAANVYPIDFGVPASDGPEDDLEAYMKEIKLRENHNSAALWAIWIPILLMGR